VTSRKPRSGPRAKNEGPKSTPRSEKSGASRSSACNAIFASSRASGAPRRHAEHLRHDDRRDHPWGGRFARSTITTTKGWVSGPPPTAEDVIDHWDEIVDQDGAMDYPNDVMIFAYENMRLLYGR
jgi:hypothetical protein